jgi:hypothetical protein
LSGWPTLASPAAGSIGLRAFGLDACLEVEGLPQSATGQATIFTGVNAAKALGHHKGPYPGPRVLEVIKRHSLFARAAEAGRNVCLANGYPPEYQEEIDARRRRHTSTVQAALAGGANLRGLTELASGEAVSGNVTNSFLRSRLGHTELPLRSAEESGRLLAAIATQHDVTVFEYSATDWAGHGRGGQDPAAVVAELDAFADATLEALPPDVSFWFVSDHGNVEDLSTRSHTKHPALCIRRGSARPLASLADVAADVLAELGVAARG